MIAVSGALVFGGYQLLVYGWSQVRGSNAGFFDVLWPGRFKGALPDAAAAAPPASPPAANTVGGKTPGGVTITNTQGLGAPSSPILHGG